MSKDVIGAFREYLNKKYGHVQYQARPWPYGDYLYHQDRDLFVSTLLETLAGRLEPDFNRGNL